MHPDNVDTGAVILTGEALRRENAKAIADVLAEVGRRVRLRRGRTPHGVDARRLRLGRGQGVARSRRRRCSTSTSAAAPRSSPLVEAGKVVHTAAIHLGGRLAVVDAEGRLTRLDPAGKRLAALAGCDWSLGDTVSEAELERVTAWMADALVAALTQDPAPPDVDGLVADRAARRRSAASRARCSRAAWASTSTGARSATSATSAAASGTRSASASPRGASRFRCCPRASASAPRRSAPRSTACSCRATPSTSRARASSCRARTCRCSSPA